MPSCNTTKPNYQTQPKLVRINGGGRIQRKENGGSNLSLRPVAAEKEEQAEGDGNQNNKRYRASAASYYPQRPSPQFKDSDTPARVLPWMSGIVRRSVSCRNEKNR